MPEHDKIDTWQRYSAHECLTMTDPSMQAVDTFDIAQSKKRRYHNSLAVLLFLLASVIVVIHFFAYASNFPGLKEVC
jgi:hypothetical protein